MLFVNIVLPMFLLIILGWVLAYFNVVGKELAKNLVLYVFYVAFPAVIFYTLSAYHIHEFLVWRFWLAYPLVTAIIVVASLIVFRACFKESAVNAMIASLSAGIKNTLLIGFPVLLSLVGRKAAIPMAITVIIFTCVLSPVMLFVFELNSQLGQEKSYHHIVGSTLKNTAKNPLIISALLGIIFSVFHIPVPGFVGKTLNYFSLSVVPCALFAVGIELNGFTLKGNVSKTLFVTIAALIACPVLAIFVCFMLKLSPFYSVALVLFSAMPTAKSMFIYASKYQYFQEEASAIVSLTTILSIVTIPAFIYICHDLWPSVFLSVTSVIH
jgi:malonate transporter and related proteins